MPLDVARSFRDEAGVRTMEARALRDGKMLDVVAVREGAGPWQIAVRSSR